MLYSSRPGSTALPDQLLFLLGSRLSGQALKGKLLGVRHLNGSGFSLDGPFAIEDVANALVGHADAFGDPGGCLPDARNQLVGIVGGRVVVLCVGCHVTSRYKVGL